MQNRLSGFIQLKRNAYSLAEERGFFKKGIKTYDLSLNLKERYITENIIRRTWDYHKLHRTNITDGQETRLIMQNCIYAGMLAAKNLNISENDLLSTLDQYNITLVKEYVERILGFSANESYSISLVAKGLVQDVYNNNGYLYDTSTPEGHWTYYKDIACVLFELGALYYNNRDD